MFRTLLAHYGEQNWWPADSAFEVVAGAILVQNTAWTNAEQAVLNLKRERSLTLRAVHEIPLKRLETLVRPAGFFRVKAQTLKAFATFVRQRHGGSLRRALNTPTEILRPQLLSIKGIGPETADAILLYAGGHEVFVVDAYARRVLRRHGIENHSDVEINSRLRSGATAIAGVRLHNRLPRHPASRMSRRPVNPAAKLNNEIHAVLVRVGVEYCRTRPLCEQCPLQPFLPEAHAPLAAQQHTETEQRDANPV